MDVWPTDFWRHYHWRNRWPTYLRAYYKTERAAAYNSCKLSITLGHVFFAENFQASGVLAVVTASIILGKGQHELLDAQSRLEMRTIWKSAVFFMEATIFILIGMALRSVIHAAGGLDSIFSKTIPLAFVVTLSAIAARFLWVFTAIYLPRAILSNLYLEIEHYPVSVPIIISWAGMRGVVSLAIALALPTNFPQRDFIIITAFMVTSITIIVQGGILTRLIKWLNFEQAMALENKFIDEHHAREKYMKLRTFSYHQKQMIQKMNLYSICSMSISGD